MRKYSIILLLSLTTYLSSYAQIPELDIIYKPLNDGASGIEKARDHYLKGDHLMSEALLYAELEKGKFTPNDFLFFANALNQDNKPSLAKEFYREYAKLSKSSNNDIQISTIFSSADAGESSPIEVDLPLNNPTSYGNMVYDAKGTSIVSYSRGCDGSLTGMKTEIISSSEYGSASFFDGGTKAIVSILDKANSSSKLYLLTKKKGKWKKPKELFSGVEGNFAFPHVDEATKMLYFSSDKKGGFGGYDVYQSSYNGTTFESPYNLGEGVNSVAHEVNPTLHGEWLYVSSNGHISKGGYDIFKYKKIPNGAIVLLNCTELNSNENDFSMISLGNSSSSVHRVNSSKSNIVLVSKPEVQSIIQGSVKSDNGKSLENAFILLDGKANTYSKTNTEGDFVLRSNSDLKNFKAVLMADGYESSEVSLSAKGPNTFTMTKIKPVEVVKEVEKVVYKEVAASTPAINYGTTTAMPAESRVTIPQTISTEVSTANSGSSRADRGLYYIIIGSTNEYSAAYDFWNKWMPSFNGTEILEYDNNLYRIGFYAGPNEEKAMESFKKARAIKKDVWILRPKG